MENPAPLSLSILTWKTNGQRRHAGLLYSNTECIQHSTQLLMNAPCIQHPLKKILCIQHTVAPGQHLAIDEHTML